MSREELVGWAGLIIGVPGFLLLFIQGQAVTALALIALCGVLVWIRWSFSQPDFTLLQVERTIAFQDPQATVALMERRQVARANHKGLVEFCFKNIVADGAIRNLLINGKPPDYQGTSCGATEVCKYFPKPLERGQTDELTLTYELVDSFNKDSEAIIHSIAHKTKLLRVIVKCHQQRPIRNAHASMRFGGNLHRNLPPPKLSNNACQIEFEMKRPRLGAQYYVEWDW